MKKYQWTIIIALTAFVGCLAGLEGGLLGAAAGVICGTACLSLLIISLIKLDLFDFPEDSVLEAIALRIQQPACPAPAQLEQTLPQTLYREIGSHTAA